MMKQILTAGLFVASVFAVALLWREPYVLTAVMVVISLLLNLIFRWRYVIFFVICAVLGPLTEAICIAFGVWQYGNAQIFGFPLWLPFVWGSAAIFFASLWRYIEKMRAK